MSSQETLLGDIRVLDLSDEKGVYCTKLLADLGADVLRIEPPGGHPMRNLGPFVHDEIDPEKSLYWFQFNTSKRGITLNLENDDGQEIFKRLVKTADVIVETFRPGYLEDIGLGYDDLKEINPRIILTSITPFGQTGPFRDFEGSDLIAQAMGGLMHCLGFPDDPPCRIGASQSHYCGSIEGALGTVVALYAREDIGVGQQVDVSCQEAVLLAMETAMQAYDMRKEIKARIARPTAIVPGIGLYECADGHIFAYVVAGFGASWDVIVDWLDSEGKAGDLKDPKWQEVWDIITNFKALIALINDMPRFFAMLEKFTYVNERLADMLKPKTKKQVYEEASSRRVMLCPAQNAKDLIESPQLNALGFFVDVEHPELGMTIKYPGAPYYHISDTPWRISRRAPLIGEHNDEIYVKELGLKKEQLTILKGQGAI